MSTMALPWTRRRWAQQTQRLTEEQLSTVAGQLIEAGHIIGRLEAVASQFELIAMQILQGQDSEEAVKDG